MAEFRILSASVFFACLIILVLLTTHPEGKLKYNRFLIVSFFFLCTHQFAVTLEEHSIIPFEQLSWIGLFCILMYLPAFWLYIRDLKEKPSNFFAHYLFWLLAFGISLLENVGSFLESHRLATYLFIGSLTTYLALNVKELTSRVFWSSSTVKKWAYPFVAIIIAINLIYVTEAIFMFMNINIWKSKSGGRWANWYYYSVHLIFCLMIIRNMVQNPSLFTNYRVVKKYSESKGLINTSEIGLIQKVVIEDKLFLDPDLTRSSLSEITGLSINRISEITNRHYKAKFTDWINDLRISHAAELLLYQDLSIKEVFNQSGFNSKSAFNTAFKKRKGVTPSIFRKTINPID